VRHYLWLAHNGPIRLLLVAWGVSYAGDLAAFTAASVYAYHAGGAGLVGLLGLAKALPGALLVPLVTSWSDRVRRERLLVATVIPRALLLAAAVAVMAGGGQAVLVVVLVALEGGLASVFRQVQAALLPWLARTPDELTSANTAASVMQSAALFGGPPSRRACLPSARRKTRCLPPARWSRSGPGCSRGSGRSGRRWWYGRPGR